MVDLVTRKQYAQHRKVSIQRINKLYTDGRLVMVGRMVNLNASDMALDAVTELRGGDRSNECVMREKINYIEQKTNELYWGNELKRLSVTKRAGELVEVRKVQQEAVNQARLLRNALLNIPDRLSDILAAESDPRAVHAILLDEIRAVLNMLARNG